MANGRRDPLAGQPWILFLIIIAVLVALGVGGWWFFGRDADSTTKPPEASSTPAKAKPKPKVPAPAPKAYVPAPPRVAAAQAPAREPNLQRFRYVPRSDVTARLASMPARTAASGPCRPGDTGKPFLWQHSGGNPYAANEDEAFSDAKLDRMLSCFQIRKDHWAQIKAHLRDTNNGEKVTLAEGTRIDKMMFGAGLVINSVIVKITGGQRALKYDLEVDGVRYVFILPLRCWNWSLMAVQDQPCPIYRQQVKAGDMVILATVRPLPRGTACKPMIKVAGTSEFVSPSRFPRCAMSLGYNCDLTEAARMAGGTPQEQLAYIAVADGITEVRLPAMVTIVSCLVSKGESGDEKSCGVITKPQHYRFDSRLGTHVATVYAKKNLPASLSKTHWDQYWRPGSTGCPVRPN